MDETNDKDKIWVTVERKFSLGGGEFIQLSMGESRTIEQRGNKARSLARKSVAKQINSDLEEIADDIAEKES